MRWNSRRLPALCCCPASGSQVAAWGASEVAEEAVSPFMRYSLSLTAIHGTASHTQFHKPCRENRAEMVEQVRVLV